MARDACPACGNAECDRDVEYVGENPIHASDHPYNRNRRAEERIKGRHM